MLKKLFLALFASFALMSAAFAVVDLNTANQAQLESLTGIGPAKAKDIIDYRTKNGPFKSAEDVMKVPGIKEGTFAKIKGEISVGGKVAAPAKVEKADKAVKASSVEKTVKASAPAKAEKPAKASAPAKK